MEILSGTATGHATYVEYSMMLPESIAGFFRTRYLIDMAADADVPAGAGITLAGWRP